MNRITCEVCGTAFQDTASCCPICGWRPDGAAVEPAVDPAELENFNVDDITKELEADAGKQKQSRRVFDFDEANGDRAASVSAEDDDTDYYSSAPDDEEPQKTNTGLVVVLVIFIALVQIGRASCRERV